MPRLPRVCPPGVSQHIVQRGHNRQCCFIANTDYATYASGLHRAALRFDVQVHAWVFMTNHVHLLVTPLHKDSISKMMQKLNRNYVCYFNETYQRSGTLWEGRFKSCLVESSNYLLQCYRYIELNPVRAGMVTDPADYAWSSYRCNALGVHSPMLTPHSEYLALSGNSESRLSTYRGFFTKELEIPALQNIREATSRNMALGSDRFRNEIESSTARRVTPSRPGRRRKYDSDTYLNTSLTPI